MFEIYIVRCEINKTNIDISIDNSKDKYNIMEIQLDKLICMTVGMFDIAILILYKYRILIQFNAINKFSHKSVIQNVLNV